MILDRLHLQEGDKLVDLSTLLSTPYIQSEAIGHLPMPTMAMPSSTVFAIFPIALVKN